MSGLRSNPPRSAVGPVTVADAQDPGPAGRVERERFEPVVVSAGVGRPDPRSTSAVIPATLVGRWLAGQAPVVRGRLLDVGAGNRPWQPWYAPLVDQSMAVDVGTAANP